MEEAIIKNIRNGIRSIKLGSKSPKDASLGSQFVRLKPLNLGMHDDLMKEYKAVVLEYNTKNPQT